jgi:hypothetical protein
MLLEQFTLFFYLFMQLFFLRGSCIGCLDGSYATEQVVFVGVRQTSVWADGIVVAMRTIPPVAKKGGVY